MSTSREKIIFAGPNSYVVRNWLASGLVDLVDRELDLEPVLVTPFGDDSFEGQAGRRFANRPVPSTLRKGQDFPADFPRLLLILYYLRLRTFAQEIENGSIQLMGLAARRDAVHYFVRGVRAIAPRGSTQRRSIRRLVDAVNPTHPACARVFDEIQPVALVVGSPGMLFLDQLMLVEARRRGVPVHCVVNSWDNLSSRGSMVRRPDTLMVWNQPMAKQAVDIHEYPAERISIVGALQFTQYDERPTVAETHALYQRLGLPPRKPYLLYFTGQHVPAYEAEDVAALLSNLEDTEFENYPLVVRVHPQAPTEPFRAVTHRNLVLDLPPRFASRGSNGAAFDCSEMRAMAALLANSSVTFSSWATTALLEAALFDRPIVQLRWMDTVARSRPEQAALVRALQRYEHLKAFDATECRIFSDHPDDLVDRLAHLRKNAAALRLGRVCAAEALVTLPLGDAPARVVAALRRALGRDAIEAPAAAALA